MTYLKIRFRPLSNNLHPWHCAKHGKILKAVLELWHDRLTYKPYPMMSGVERIMELSRSSEGQPLCMLQTKPHILSPSRVFMNALPHVKFSHRLIWSPSSLSYLRLWNEVKFKAYFWSYIIQNMLMIYYFL